MKNISVLLFTILGLSVILKSPVFYTIYIFGDFPIKGLRYDLNTPIASDDCLECPERFPLSTTMRIVLSVIWYALLLAVLAVIPLCLAKRFKSNSFYQAYKTFWLCGSFIFLLLTGILTGGIHTGTYGIGIVIFLVTLYTTIAYLAILPAYFQNKHYNKQRIASME